MIQYENRVYIRSCKMVLWPIRARVLFELFYKNRFLKVAEAAGVNLSSQKET